MPVSGVRVHRAPDNGGEEIDAAAPAEEACGVHLTPSVRGKRHGPVKESRRTTYRVSARRRYRRYVSDKHRIYRVHADRYCLSSRTFVTAVDFCENAYLPTYLPTIIISSPTRVYFFFLPRYTRVLCVSQDTALV